MRGSGLHGRGRLKLQGFPGVVAPSGHGALPRQFPTGPQLRAGGTEKQNG